MTDQEILNRLQTVKNGRYFHLKKSKDLGNGVSKITDMVIRLGVNYSHLSINDGKTTGSLPWGQWVAGLENLVIEHKGKYYLRVTSTTPENPEGADVLETKYFKDNQEISKVAAESLADSKKLQSKASAVYNIKFENILAI